MSRVRAKTEPEALAILKAQSFVREVWRDTYGDGLPILRVVCDNRAHGVWGRRIGYPCCWIVTDDPNPRPGGERIWKRPRPQPTKP
jgi:hypothetical protein